MKRYDLMVFEEKDGTVHANMVEDVDGMYVTYYDALKGIQYAVAAERRRVWDEIIDRIDCGGHDDHPVDELRRLRDDLFPDGEPKTE